MRLACDIGIQYARKSIASDELIRRLTRIRAEHRRLWLECNRIGGLQESTHWLTSRVAQLTGSGFWYQGQVGAG
jgi:hypothetical protein